MLLSALKRKGYNASVHQVPQDKLFHIQLGPFATRKDAEAMRQKLIADGYNAIVK
jgi:cell division septation protein DedD